MPSNSMYACVACRRGGKVGGSCPRCGDPMTEFGPRITLPKKNNDKAWNKIKSGNLYWDDKKVAKKPYRSTWVSYNLEQLKINRAKRMLKRWTEGDK